MTVEHHDKKVFPIILQNNTYFLGRNLIGSERWQIGNRMTWNDGANLIEQIAHTLPILLFIYDDSEIKPYVKVYQITFN